jgi:hypothetical protein
MISGQPVVGYVSFSYTSVLVGLNDALRTLETSRLDAEAEQLLFHDGDSQRGFIGMGASPASKESGQTAALAP